MIIDEFNNFYDKELSFNELIIKREPRQFYLSVGAYGLGTMVSICLLYEYKYSWYPLIFMFFLFCMYVISIWQYIKTALKTHYDGIDTLQELRDKKMRVFLGKRRFFNLRILNIIRENKISEKTIYNFPPLSITTIIVTIILSYLNVLHKAIPLNVALSLSSFVIFATLTFIFFVKLSHDNKSDKCKTIIKIIDSYRIELELNSGKDIKIEPIRIRDILPSRCGYYVSKIMDYTLGN